MLFLFIGLPIICNGPLSYTEQLIFETIKVLTSPFSLSSLSDTNWKISQRIVRALCPLWAFLNCFQLFLPLISTNMQIRIFLGLPYSSLDNMRRFVFWRCDPASTTTLSFMSFLVVKVLTKLAMFQPPLQLAKERGWRKEDKTRKGRSGGATSSTFECNCFCPDRPGNVV